MYKKKKKNIDNYIFLYKRVSSIFQIESYNVYSLTHCKLALNFKFDINCLTLPKVIVTYLNS